MIVRRALLAGLLAAVPTALAMVALGQEAARRIAVDLREGRAEGEGIVRPARGAGTLRLRQGERVEILWSVDRPADIHLHGYGVEVRAAVGAVATMAFTARAAGRFAVEVHDAGGRHVTVLYLEVHPR
ncbi:MAG: hypothetical protein ACK5WM_14105 [Rhodospirillales bacterium]|jgi:hypothetical protein